MWQMSLLSCATALVMLIAHWQRKRAAPIAADAPVYLAPGRAAIGNRVLPRWQRLWRREWSERVAQHIQARAAAGESARRAQALIATGLRLDEPSAGGLALCAGFIGENLAELDLVADGPHGLIIGPTGVGKSQLLRLLLTSALTNNATLQIALADFKGGATLRDFASQASCRGFVTDLSAETERSVFWDAIAQELSDRQSLFALTGAADLAAFNAVAAPLGRLLVVIDELQAGLLQQPKLVELLEAVAARGRSLGIHLLACTQNTSGVPRSLVSNLRLRFAVGSIDPLDLVQLGGSTTTAMGASSKPGWATAKLIQIAEPTRELRFPLGVGPQQNSKATTPVLPPAPQSSGHVPVQPERW